jgi:hypothetical protein
VQQTLEVLFAGGDPNRFSMNKSVAKFNEFSLHDLQPRAVTLKALEFDGTRRLPGRDESIKFFTYAFQIAIAPGPAETMIYCHELHL